MVTVSITRCILYTLYSACDKFVTRYTMMYDGSMLLMQSCSYKYNTVQFVRCTTSKELTTTDREEREKEPSQ